VNLKEILKEAKRVGKAKFEADFAPINRVHNPRIREEYVTREYCRLIKEHE